MVKCIVRKILEFFHGLFRHWRKEPETVIIDNSVFKWTKKPTKPGLYWHRCGPYATSQCIEWLEYRGIPPVMYRYVIGFDLSLGEGWCYEIQLSEHSGEFLGPL